MVQAFWNKLNGNEKMVGYGAVLIVVAFLAATASGFGAGPETTSLIVAVVIFAIYWTKQSNMKIPWPVPLTTVVLGIAAVAAVLALLALLGVLSAITRLDGIASLLNFAGCGVMAFAAYKEYQATLPKATPPAA
ncbi:MAG TPA: hypothetical protein VIF63_09410 [Candidatus Limnocylindrales bacterium]|jgi:hypothetical protein